MGSEKVVEEYDGVSKSAEAGLEPAPTRVDWILSPARLPFRHLGRCLKIVRSFGRVDNQSATFRGQYSQIDARRCVTIAD